MTFKNLLSLFLMDFYSISSRKELLLMLSELHKNYRRTQGFTNVSKAWKKGMISKNCYSGRIFIASAAVVMEA